MSAPKPSGPSELLFSILVTFLTPLFLGGQTGNSDLEIARAAAIQALNSFRIRTHWDLFTVVQIIGFGMAALGSIGLSLQDDMSVNAVLRCRSNANALQRSSDRAQDRLEKRQARDQQDTDSACDPPDEATVLELFRSAAQAQRDVAEARAALQNQETEDSPMMQAIHRTCDTAQDPAPPHLQPASETATPNSPPARAATVPPTEAARPAQPTPKGAHPRISRTDQERQVVWADAMATVARELTQEMARLPPAEQQLQAIRISALTDAAHQLTRGTPVSPAGLPPPFGRTAPPRTAAHRT